MKGDLNTKRIRLIYIMLIANLCMSIICTAAILTFVTTHKNSNNNSNETITQENTEYDVSALNEINTDTFIKLFKSNKKSLVYIGRPTCSHCVNFVPTITKVQKEFEYQTNYLDLDKISENDFKRITELDSYFEENFGVTPMVIIVENGKIIESKSTYSGLGECSYDDFIDYLKSINFIK